MQVCEHYRISHSHFLGGPPRWTAADRDKAIWWQAHKVQTCHACHTHPDDWDPAKGGHRRAYRVVEKVCPGCEMLQRAQDQQAGDVPLRGAYLAMERMRWPS